MSRIHPHRSGKFLLVFMALAHRPADVFVLAGGGRVTGELINRDESPRQQYVIQAADGATVTLDAAQVQTGPPPPSRRGRVRADSAHLCRHGGGPMGVGPMVPGARLSAQREVHLRRVIELDPNHAEARHALGYSQVDGQWATRELK